MEDRDFIDFKFGDHWASDFNLLAVSSGDRYSPPVYGSVNPNTAIIAGKVGVYKWKTQVNEKVFNIKIAFDNINGQILNQIKEWLNPFKIDKLVFKEEPYKYYWVALNTEPKLDFLPFLEETKVVNGIAFKEGVYKGEFELQFVCFDNYGYSDWQSFDENYDYVVKEIEGEGFISFNDGSDNNLIITKIGGNHSQETREGYNLAKYTKGEYTSNTLSSLGSFNLNLDKNINVSNGDELLFSADIKLVSGTACKMNTLRASSGSQKGEVITNPILTSTYQRYVFKNTFSVDGEISAFAFQVANNADSTVIQVDNLMISKENKDYEPYGAMPSPDYPSPVETVGQNGSVEIEVCNKNLFESPLIGYAIMGSNTEGFNVNKIPNGVTYIAKLKNNQNYYIKKNNNIGDRFRIVLFNDYPVSTTYLKDAIQITSDKNLSKYGFNSDKYNYVAFTVNADSIYSGDCLAQLELSSTATDYIPHQSYTKVLPIQQEMLKGDKFIKQDGKWYEAHYNTKMVFDGTESWDFATTKEKTQVFSTIIGRKMIQLISNYFSVNGSGDVEKMATDLGRTVLYVAINKDRLNEVSVKGFQNYLKSKYDAGVPVIIYLTLENPNLIPCTTEQSKILDEMENNLYSYEGTNHIFSTNEISPKLSISYIPKQDIYIDYVVNQSNLLNDSAFYYENNIYKKSYFDAETGDATKSGISEDRPIYLYNAGTTAANLNLTFDMIIPAEGSPLVINTENCKLTDNGVQVLKQVSSISISDFSKYKPFLEIYDGTPSNWQIQIDSNLCEVYLKHKTDKTKIISLNKFNDNQSFLSLTNCNFVDYSKPFPTLITAISGTALENTVFNKLSVGTSAQNYRLKNVNVEWRHTYL